MKRSGSCSVGSEGKPSSITSSRNCRKAAFRCSETTDRQMDTSQSRQQRPSLQRRERLSYRSDAAGSARPCRRSWPSAARCSTSSHALHTNTRQLTAHTHEHGGGARLTLSVRLQVPRQLHGQDGVQEGGDERRVQTTHRPEHLQQQQTQRHAVLLNIHTHQLLLHYNHNYKHNYNNNYNSNNKYNNNGKYNNINNI